MHEQQHRHAGIEVLCSCTATSLVSATAASDARTKSGTASEVAAYTARLQLLQVALQQSAKSVISSSTTAARGDEQGNRGTETYPTLAGHRSTLLLAGTASPHGDSTA